MSDEGRIRTGGIGYGQSNGRVSGANTNHVLHFWAWNYVRTVNEAIMQLSDQSSSLDESFRETRLGQAYFFRAFAYFKMVSRYGGVPIITEVQDVSQDPETLKSA